MVPACELGYVCGSGLPDNESATRRYNSNRAAAYNDRERREGLVMAVVFWVFALAAGYWLYTDYQASGSLTGKAYYEACWELKAKTKGFTEATPSTPYQAAQWKQCEPVMVRAVFMATV